MLVFFCFDHFFEFWFECSIESFCIDDAFVLSKNFGDAEFDVWNCVLAGKYEGWDDIFFIAAASRFGITAAMDLRQQILLLVPISAFLYFFLISER